jgi:hypothetical protein
MNGLVAVRLAKWGVISGDAGSFGATMVEDNDLDEVILAEVGGSDGYGVVGYCDSTPGLYLLGIAKLTLCKLPVRISEIGAGYSLLAILGS